MTRMFGGMAVSDEEYERLNPTPKAEDDPAIDEVVSKDPDSDEKDVKSTDDFLASLTREGRDTGQSDDPSKFDHTEDDVVPGEEEEQESLEQVIEAHERSKAEAAKADAAERDATTADDEDQKGENRTSSAPGIDEKDADGETIDLDDQSAKNGKSQANTPDEHPDPEEGTKPDGEAPELSPDSGSDEPGPRAPELQDKRTPAEKRADTIAAKKAAGKKG